MTDPDLHPHRRFSARVENYVRYRPAYPEALLPLLETHVGLTPSSVVADVGAGTGIFSRLLLDYGCMVYAVEPNPEMRAASAAQLSTYDRFHPVAGSAASTTLPANSVDLVTAAQAFHWFEPDEALVELPRILRPWGYVAVVYNLWRGAGDPVLAGFDAIVERYDPEAGSKTANPVSVPQRLDSFFGTGAYQKADVPNPYFYSWEELRGRALSSSYAPLPGTPNHEPFMAELRGLFEAHAVEGRVYFPYTTRVVWGRPRTT